ncbi:AlpA family transcriptional regulator [Bradyrhizobium sp. th.b2]|uniref:helix-turn-helix transcriptional regulator n=1 Tax=Bradyrhizobium sp. th-b2 TaxID=172088 RepID=UPI0003F90463|nr:AlpA family phage regulatory protein [Bradyrhizobium sp. th.b2]
MSQFWRLPKVQQETGLSRSSIYELMAAKQFPKSFPLTERCVAWVSAEVEQWKADRLRAAGKVLEAA